MTKEETTYRIFEHIGDVDISEQDIYDYDPEVLSKLLVDHTMSAKARAEAKDPSRTVNIFWATADYENSVQDENGSYIAEGYRYNDEIKPENITGSFRRIVMPRVLKDKQAQLERTKGKAEVFTPSWVCNAQNNLIDEAWFGRKDVFNSEVTNADGTHTWIPTEGKIAFPEGDKQKTWKRYVTDNRLEITCGEAPYLVSRYDTTTGEPIPIGRRIGLLDRKLRVVNENVETEAEWYAMAEKAFKHTYGYEWQGDNLLLAREALLYTYIEYFIDKFNAKDADGNYQRDASGHLRVPSGNKILNAARWISWNIWQMDGIKMVVPDSCHKIEVCTNQKEIDRALKEKEKEESDPRLPGLVYEPIQIPVPKYELKECPGCATGDHAKHTGTPCIIRDWNRKKPQDWMPQEGEDPHSQPWQKIEFRSLLHDNQSDEDDADCDVEVPCDADLLEETEA